MRLALPVALLIAVAPARAQEPPEIDQATWHLEQAQRAFELGAYAVAIAEFGAAAPAMRGTQLDYDLARCLDRLGHEAAAMAHYRAASRAIGDDAYSRAARERMDELILRASLRQRPPLPLGPPLTLGIGAALVGIVGGTLVASVASPLAALKTADCAQPCSAARALHVRADVGYALLTVAAATAVVDVALWIRWSRSRRPPSLEMWQTGAGLRF